ncbi:YqzM family protein [Brevibacillus sp. NRS-1366]|uniref:YqzM family protein n=1 Tax=Brevibacillus sp. NRS-1366 TaxID=3233899 RepID=UPI003D216B6D
MAGSNKKDMNQNDVIDSAKAFFTSFGILFLVFLIALVGSIIFPPQHGGEAQGNGGAPTANIDAAAIFKQNCASCHGQNLEGIMGPNLTKVGATHSADDIAKIIKDGKPPAMPGGIIKKQPEIQAVAQWLSEHK